MKRLGMVLAIVMLFTTVFSATALAGGGNGAPSGAHYNLNIVGVDNPKTADMQDSSRHTIFVPLWGKCNIELVKAPEGESYRVLDGNCFTGGNETPLGTKLNAAFQLPPPDAALDGTLDYSVWVRVPPGQKGEAWMTTCYYDSVDNAEYCMTGATVHLTANKQFTDVSKQLLTVCANLGTLADPEWKTVPLFYGTNDMYWWEYNNQGLKIAQLRFYPANENSGYPLLNPCTAPTRTK